MARKNVDVNLLQEKAVQLRRDILTIVNRAGCGHPGGSLSAVEIFIALYHYKMAHRPQDPQWADRDRLIVSKGHCSPVTYVALADAGYFPKKELEGYRTFGSRLQGHVHVKVPGVEFNTGSLGHGLSVANGIALGARLNGKTFKTYCLMGDGEIQEGSVWEAAMSAAHWQLGSVCAIIDYNKVQENGPVREIKDLEPLSSKWSSFGWHVIEVDGHDLHELFSALDDADTLKDQPTVIIANTVKGKGVSFMEGDHRWHGKAPNPEQLASALGELDG